MKDSGIEWIGKIPEEWSHSKLALICDVIVDGTHFRPTYVENGIPFLRVTDIQRSIINWDDVKKISKEEHQILIKRCNPQKNDLLLSKNGTIGVSMIVNWEQEFSMFVSLALIKVNKDLLDVHFLKQFFDSKLAKDQIHERSKSTTVTNLHLEEIKEFQIPLPEIQEQKQISDFLDSQTKLIDSQIKSNQKLVTLLQEKRQATINQAVTKGLDPTVPMKDSGIEWIGDIPEHWDVLPFFNICKENNIKNFKNKIENVLSLSYGRIIQRDLENNFGLIPKSFDTYQIVRPGYIVMRLTDLQNDKVSLRVGLVKEIGIITSAYLGLIVDEKMHSDYFYNLLHLYDLKKIFYGMGGGVRQSIGYFDLKHLPIIITSLKEQKQISDFLDGETTKIDSLISKTETQIEKLQEFRQSLISATVTGKIDVRTNHEKVN